MNKNYRACATCQHFQAVRIKKRQMLYRCKRLGFETKPHYKFNCWQPRPDIKKRMEEGI